MPLACRYAPPEAPERFTAEVMSQRGGRPGRLVSPAPVIGHSSRRLICRPWRVAQPFPARQSGPASAWLPAGRSGSTGSHRSPADAKETVPCQLTETRPADDDCSTRAGWKDSATACSDLRRVLGPRHRIRALPACPSLPTAAPSASPKSMSASTSPHRSGSTGVHTVRSPGVHSDARPLARHGRHLQLRVGHDLRRAEPVGQPLLVAEQPGLVGVVRGGRVR